VEAALGRPRFLQLYFLSGIVGGLLQVLASWVFPGHFGAGPVVGASAGVFGVVGAFAAVHPEQTVTTYVAMILPVTLRAKYLVIGSGILIVLGLLDRRSGVAHAAHAGGLLFGLAFIRYRLGSETWWSERFKRFRKARRHEKASGRGGVSGVWRKETGSEEAVPGEFISREVDPILDKISAHGIQSLTEQEKRILEAARARMARR
jgi:hypothetical protein